VNGQWPFRMLLGLLPVGDLWIACNTMIIACLFSFVCFVVALNVEKKCTLLLPMRRTINATMFIRLNLVTGKINIDRDSLNNSYN
jgi:hypothetical protein